jgi:DNA-binding NarL/FixJ family response regulator
MSLDTAYRPWVPELPPIHNLTAREVQVLQAAADGEKVIATARHLNMAPGTVKTHRSNIGRKLKVHTTAAAVATALRKGIIQ